MYDFAAAKQIIAAAVKKYIRSGCTTVMQNTFGHAPGSAGRIIDTRNIY
jgi:hypothetical protein